MPKEWDQLRKANQTMPISKRYGIKTTILWLPRGMRLEFWKNDPLIGGHQRWVLECHAWRTYPRSSERIPISMPSTP